MGSDADPKSKKGFDQLNKSKQVELEEKFRKQKKLKDEEFEDYNPWGKPGHGAPNEDTLRKRKIFMEILPPVELKPTNNDMTVMGRPGGGAPMKTKSGKAMNAIVEDPQLRFQFNGPIRKIVDIDLRYRIPIVEQQAYKAELDRMVKEKKNIDVKEDMDAAVEDVQLGSEAGKFRRLGSHPMDNKDLYRKFSYIDDAIHLEELTGGIELEPLLAIRRRQGKKWPLGTTDVTGILNVKPNITINEREYSEILQHQMEEKEESKLMTDVEKKVEETKHFENWDKFWGRPGYGAPKPIKVKENLEYILYHLPVLIRKKEGESTWPPESEGNVNESM